MATLKLKRPMSGWRRTYAKPAGVALLGQHSLLYRQATRRHRLAMNMTRGKGFYVVPSSQPLDRYRSPWVRAAARDLYAV